MRHCRGSHGGGGGGVSDGIPMVAVEEDAADLDGAGVDVNTVIHTGMVRRKFVDELPDHIPVRSNPYKVSGTTNPPQDMRNVSRVPLSMQKGTANPRLSTVEGLLQW